MRKSANLSGVVTGGGKVTWPVIFATRVIMLQELEMVRQVRIRQSGGSLTATLPKDMTDRLHLQSGDSVYAIETEKGILLTPYDPDFEKAWKIYQEASRKYREALRELAR
jgi:putative addiction module antidote